MLSKTAKENYLNRELYSADWMKVVPESKIDKVIAKLHPKPEFHTEPYFHQKVGFLIGINQPNWLFFWTMGTGKTRTILDIIGYRQKLGQIKKSLVLVPNVVNIENWDQEAQKHTPYMRVMPLVGSTKEREELLEQDADLYIINYMGLVYLCTDFVRRGQSGSGRRLNKDKIKKLAKNFDCMVCDESQNIKSHRSLSAQICSRMASVIPYRYGLTGTPFGRDPHDLWSQFYVIDRGETLGYTLSIFRECFFNKKKNYWGGYEFTFRKQMTDKLNRMLKNKSIRYEAEECQDLPDKIYSQRIVTFPTENYTYYKKIVEDIIASQGNYEEMKNAFIRMRQIASGFLGHKDKEGNRIEFELPYNPKLDALMDLIDGLPEDEKIVIFNEFIKSGHIIERSLKDKKIKYTRLYSGTKDPVKAISRFQKDNKCRVFLCQSQSGSVGVNLQSARYCIFYESPVSPIVRQQAEKRIHRSGQTKKCFYYDIVMHNSVDEKVLVYLSQGKDLFEALMKGDERWWML